jgi:hypothetical protein
MSQASDGKEALGGRQPTFRFQVVFLISFLLLSNIQKHKKILAETDRRKKIFVFQYCANRDTFWAKRDTICPPSEAPLRNFSKLKKVPFDISKNVSRC